MHPNFTIISGGQTGPDTAALKTAISHRIPYTGFVPHGFTNERGRISDAYISSPYGSLRETGPPDASESTENAERTRLNCEDADGLLTLAFCKPEELHLVSRGTELGVATGLGERREMYFVDLRRFMEDPEGEVAGVMKWLDETNIEKCAIGGPRESEEPGVEAETEAFLGKVWDKAKERGWKSIRFGGVVPRGKIEPFLRDNRWTS
ncbi:hypothetical protein H072_7518 [Dactylellina haptotyla CBS 200.50]|uniref:Uncharacterized protein n=1 Tax=Dactylellina haptotyla (strain CBS 200.50) TaxID=1284197 RepID=S8BTX5_DACHA|nr:hypothetical protein H072_7518 [Dactylellina haptotyla CBS 200.50]